MTWNKLNTYISPVSFKGVDEPWPCVGTKSHHLQEPTLFKDRNQCPAPLCNSTLIPHPLRPQIPQGIGDHAGDWAGEREANELPRCAWFGVGWLSPPVAGWVSEMLTNTVRCIGTWTDFGRTPVAHPWHPFIIHRMKGARAGRPRTAHSPASSTPSHRPLATSLPSTHRQHTRVAVAGLPGTLIV